MAHVVTNSKKSPSPLVTDIRNGVDLYFGQDIIYEWQGTLYRGICQGWKLVDNEPRVKVDQVGNFGVDTVPIDKVWRIWDVRDDQIEKHQTGIEQIKLHIIECRNRIKQKQSTWVAAQNKGLWLDAEHLQREIDSERNFVNGLERALAHLTDNQEDDLL